MLQVDQSYDGRELSVKTRDTLALSLPENPTTGYRWEIKAGGEPVCKLDHTEYEAPSGGVGKGGTRRWQFSVVAAGAADLALEYRRSFEADKPPARTFTLKLNAAD